jgi:hypothetical protein
MMDGSKFNGRAKLVPPSGKRKSKGPPSHKHSVSQYSYDNIVRPEKEEDHEKPERGVVTKFRLSRSPGHKDQHHRAVRFSRVWR